MTDEKKEKIVLFISNPKSSGVVEQVLLSAGYQVRNAPDRESVELYLKTNKPDLFILNLPSSEGEGIALAREWIRQYPLLPVLLIMEKDERQLLRDALRAGVMDYVVLPVQAGALLEVIQSCLQKVQSRKDWLILESKRFTANLQHHVDEVETLANLGRSITGSLNLDKVLTSVVEAAINLSGAEEGSLLLVDEKTNELYMRASRNFQEDFVRTFRLPVNDSLAGSVVTTGKPLLLNKTDKQKIKTSYFIRSVAYVPLNSRGRCMGVLGVDNRQSSTPVTEHHLRLLSAIADYAVIAIENTAMYENLQQSALDLEMAYESTLEGWSRAMELRDRETEGHGRRVAEFTVGLSRALGIQEDNLNHIRHGALLHDIGKIGIPDAVLFKKGLLTDEEFEIMHRHPEYAYQLLSTIHYLKEALDIPYCHHENWDGTGYPRHLVGEDIPLSARAFKVIDVWDALRSNRPYRNGWQDDQVIRYITTNSGTLFDPKVVDVFLGKLDDLNKLL